MRQLKTLESEAVLTLAGQVGSDEEREQLLSDLKHCSVEEASPDGSRLIFHIEGYRRPPHRGQDTYRGKDYFPVEGVMRDADGAAIDVAIYVVYGRVYELELIRHVGGSVLEPDWNSFKLK